MYIGSEQHANGGSRDCGRFFLDHYGQFEPRTVKVRWTDEHRPSTPEIDQIIERTWQRETADAERKHRRLFDGRLCRLVDCRMDGEALELVLGPVSFKEFYGTNLTNAYLRFQHGPEYLGDALGVSTALVSADNFLVLGRRSQEVAYHPGRIHPLGGVVEPEDRDGRLPNPFETAVDEVTEETHLDREAIETPICLGLVRDKHIVQPELIFSARANADASDILRGLQDAPDSMEHSELLPVRNDPTGVVRFIEERASELTPVALATLLLHGMRSWGTGWFATARGYLRSLF